MSWRRSESPEWPNDVAFVSGECCWISSTRRFWKSVAEAQVQSAEPIPPPNPTIALPIETSLGDRLVWTMRIGVCMPRPIAAPRNPSNAATLTVLSSRLMVVSMPDAMGAKVLVANMKAGKSVSRRDCDLKQMAQLTKVVSNCVYSHS